MARRPLYHVTISRYLTEGALWNWWLTYDGVPWASGWDYDNLGLAAMDAEQAQRLSLLLTQAERRVFLLLKYGWKAWSWDKRAWLEKEEEDDEDSVRVRYSTLAHMEKLGFLRKVYEDDEPVEWRLRRPFGSEE